MPTVIRNILLKNLYGKFKIVEYKTLPATKMSFYNNSVFVSGHETEACITSSYDICSICVEAAFFF